MIVCQNAINYLNLEEIKKIIDSLSIGGMFIANTFRNLSWNTNRDNEVTYFDGDKINHFLVKENDDILHHQFYYYGESFFRDLGFEIEFYNNETSMIVKYVKKED